ncbi:MerR family transcriptional regulator [Rhabdothermincola salaria]|uniref:MerR family transcriptional regulator n=1 Tax=Rhabdothermincola salaria TaxID=2903142 RepID=UPI001E439334|nr:MerR family transcriptional regulator [Rhabdothermincola salaria]
MTVDPSKPYHQIGEVAEVVGLSLRTIRHYEEVGLVIPSGRSTGGFRLYTDADIERLQLVKDMKPLDFRLEEMRELLVVLDAVEDPTSSSAQRDALASRLGEFARAAEQRCARLRRDLAAAESLTATLTQRSSGRGAGDEGAP